MQSTYHTLCLATCEIARRAGKFIETECKNFDHSRVESKGLHDLVSYVDKPSEKQIIEQLRELLPESGFIAEEGTDNKQGERFNWIIDPLDGTTNFIHGVPVYAVSIALLDGDELVVGVVYEVGHNECFYAWKNGGAYLNDKPIKVSEKINRHDALLATGFPYCVMNGVDEYTNVLKTIIPNVRGVRVFGTTATDLAYVACGRYDMYFECNLKPWDVAAGALLVKEAGGKVTDFSGGNNILFNGNIVATNGTIDFNLKYFYEESILK